jgi:hypothetical protein
MALVASGFESVTMLGTADKQIGGRAIVTSRVAF